MPRVLAGISPLARELAERIRRDGPISFADFMDAALYHSSYGYYTSRAAAGTSYVVDFRTAPEVHGVFAELIARQVGEMFVRLGRPARFRVVELGPGTGRLATEMLPALDLLLGEENATWEYRLVERSAALVSIQKEAVSRLPERLGGRASWASAADLAADPADGVVLSNEFFDALPVHRVQLDHEEIREVRVGWAAEGGFTEVLAPTSEPDLGDYLGRYGAPLREGQAAEICLEALAWMDRVADMLQRGYVLSVDYGYPAERLYGSERSRGTLMAYHGHQALDDPLQAVGQQDLTAHVNFTALEMRGAEHGFRAAPLRTQTEFLLGLGVLDRMVEIDREARGEAARWRERMAVKELFTPGGMGERFRVLLQARDAPLRGLSGLSSPWAIGLPS